METKKKRLAAIETQLWSRLSEIDDLPTGGDIRFPTEEEAEMAEQRDANIRALLSLGEKSAQLSHVSDEMASSMSSVKKELLA